MPKTVDQFVEAAQNGDSPHIAGVGDFFIQTSPIIRFGEILPPWWSKGRDKAMSSFWKTNNLMSTLMFAAQTKISNMPLRVIARDESIDSHRRLADELTQQFYYLSEFGNGLHAAMAAFAEDYFGSDNGGFFEVVAEGEKDEPLPGVPFGLRHLDSLHVTRMSDPIFPIRYSGSTTKSATIYHYSRVISMSQMRSSRRERNGVGFCAVSRTVDIAQKYQDLLNYIRGKVGGRAFKKLIVGKNITGREIIKAIAAATAMQNEIAEVDMDSIAIGGKDIEIESIDLTNFPEYNEEDATYNTMALMALGWGLEFNEAFPIVGSKAAEEVALQRSRGRLPALFVAEMSRQATMKMVPPYLEVKIDFVDDYLDQQREIIADIRARNLNRLVLAKVLTPEAARTRLYDDKYISDTTRLNLALGDGKLPDGSPVLRVMSDPEYAEIITIDRNYLMLQADIEAVKEDAQRNRITIWESMALTNATLKQERYKIALRALDELVSAYERLAFSSQPDQPNQPNQPDQLDQLDEEEEEEQEPLQSRQEPTATKAIKANGDINDYIDSQHSDLVAALEDGPDEDEVNSIMRKAMIVAAWLALRSDPESEPPEDAKEIIALQMSLIDDQFPVIIERSDSGIDMSATATRMLSQVWRVYWNMFIGAQNDEQELSWSLGATEKHCINCLEYSEMGGRPASFWKDIAETRQHYPQSPALECSGYYCDCSLG